MGKQGNSHKRKPRAKRPPYDGPHLAFTVPELIQSGAFSSRNKVYDAITRGELRTYLAGKRRMATAEAVHEYHATRERATAEGRAA